MAAHESTVWCAGEWQYHVVKLIGMIKDGCVHDEQWLPFPDPDTEEREYSETGGNCDY